VAKRRKTMLAGLDFQGLLDLREEVNEAISGYRKSNSRQSVAQSHPSVERSLEADGAY
jgi:hypothetical protein